MRLCNRVERKRICNCVFSRYLLDFCNTGVVFIDFYYDMSSCVIITYVTQHANIDGGNSTRFSSSLYVLIDKGLCQIFFFQLLLCYFELAYNNFARDNVCFS